MVLSINLDIGSLKMQNSLKPVSAGNIPDEVNVIIEIPAHSSPVKYEIDKATGMLKVCSILRIVTDVNF
jgi:inorganic pyrophosphatase